MDIARIITAFLCGIVGLGFLLYGKREGRLPHLFTGMVLMACPFWLRDPLWLGCTGLLLLVGLKLYMRFETESPV